jgi:predicted nucleic acid-binding protein
MFLVDTNIISELARIKPNDRVLTWAMNVNQIAISVITVAEIYYGLTWKHNPRIRVWFDNFLASNCQVLPVTLEIAKCAGEIRGRLQAGGKTRSESDMIIAATAQIHQLTLVTHNIKDFTDCNLILLDPFV